MAKHIPGPWKEYKVIRETQLSPLPPPYWDVLADFDNGHGAVVAMQVKYAPNARLIAAAPDLLEALHAIMDSVDAQKVRLDVYELELAETAIAKAEDSKEL